ncbi:MAG: NIPSNAP family protein [Pyrinomonadaceae bacterium]|nr:NIPSNAP family protein [Pyrinomonadaceae bacterium]
MITCQIRYEIDLDKIAAFEQYARSWMVLIEKYGGVHHGYFVPAKEPQRQPSASPALGPMAREILRLLFFRFQLSRRMNLTAKMSQKILIVTLRPSDSSNPVRFLATNVFSLSQ